MGVAHVSLYLRLWRKGRNGVNHDDVHRAGSHESFGDFERLLSGVGLGYPELVHVHPEGASVGGVERVLGVHECCDAAQLLRLGDRMQCQCGLSGRLGSEDLHHASLRVSAETQRFVDHDRAAGNDFDPARVGSLAHLHKRALAELLLDLEPGRLYGPLFLIGLFEITCLCVFLCHINPLP